MKRIILAALVLIIGCTFANAQKTAFVDSEVILKQLPETAVITKQIEDIQKLYADTLSTKETNYKTRAEEFKTKYEDAQQRAQSGTLSESEAKTLETDLKNMQDEISLMEQEFYTYRQNIQQALVAKRDELFKPVIEKITKQIEVVAKEMKIQFVFDKNSDALIYGDKEFDITFKVLDKLK